LSCDFQSFSFYLNSRASAYNLPNIPNYNIGAGEGTDCDTTVNEIASPSSHLNFDLFPNPASSYITLTSSFNGAMLLTVQNIFGQIVFSKNLIAIEEVIDVSELSAGVYFFTVKISEGVFTKKVVKE